MSLHQSTFVLVVQEIAAPLRTGPHHPRKITKRACTRLHQRPERDFGLSGWCSGNLSIGLHHCTALGNQQNTVCTTCPDFGSPLPHCTAPHERARK